MEHDPMSTSTETAKISFRTFNPGDVDAAHGLSQVVRWPHRAEDWRFMAEAGAGFVAELDGTVIGTAPHSGWLSCRLNSKDTASGASSWSCCSNELLNGSHSCTQRRPASRFTRNWALRHSGGRSSTRASSLTCRRSRHLLASDCARSGPATHRYSSSLHHALAASTAAPFCRRYWQSPKASGLSTTENWSAFPSCDALAEDM